MNLLGQLGRFWRRAASPAAVSLSVIRENFEASAADEEHFPSTIDPRIFHVQYLQRFFGDMSAGLALDAGCGKGRFARVLLEQNPGLRLVALDLAVSMLKHTPNPSWPLCATLTRFPLRDETCDFVYATESLEHAVDVESAIGELCRVLKPGGRLVIIDKNAEHWGKLKTPAWEQWFDRRELERLLARHCREVSSDFISYWEDVPPDGMFIAWRATK